MLEFVFGIIFEIFFMWTGEVVLFLFTLGRHKPRWDTYAKESSASKFVIFSEISLWLGIAFWVLFVASVVLLVKTAWA